MGPWVVVAEANGESGRGLRMFLGHSAAIMNALTFTLKNADAELLNLFF